jgi:hypothetical protein
MHSYQRNDIGKKDKKNGVEKIIPGTGIFETKDNH